MTFIEQSFLMQCRVASGCRLLILLTFLLLMSVCVNAKPINNEELKQLLQSTLTADKGPGLMVAVYQDNRRLYSEAVGLADLEQNIPLTTNTKMRIGSVSKLFTAVASLRLADADKLDVQADIQKYLPQFPKKRWSVSPFHLATHTSGIRHYDFNNYFEANNVRFYPELEEALSTFSQEPLLFRPGSRFEYSGLGVNLLGVVLEQANKSAFAQVLESYVTRPLKLSGTMPDHPLVLVPHRTRFYTVSEAHGQAINTVWRDSSDYYPSGGILSTAEDLAKFANAVFTNDFISEQSLELMQQEVKTTEGKATGYAYGWQVTSEDGSLVYSHGGETNGAYAHVSYYPEHNLSIAGITNYNFWGAGLGEPRFFELLKAKLPALFK